MGSNFTPYDTPRLLPSVFRSLLGVAASAASPRPWARSWSASALSMSPTSRLAVASMALGAGVGVDGVQDAVEAFRPFFPVLRIQGVAGLCDGGGRLQHFVARRFHRCPHGCVVIGCHCLSALATASARWLRCGFVLAVQRAPSCAARRDARRSKFFVRSKTGVNDDAKYAE